MATAKTAVGFACPGCGQKDRATIENQEDTEHILELGCHACRFSPMPVFWKDRKDKDGEPVRYNGFWAVESSPSGKFLDKYGRVVT